MACGRRDRDADQGVEVMVKKDKKCDYCGGDGKDLDCEPYCPKCGSPSPDTREMVNAEAHDVRRLHEHGPCEVEGCPREAQLCGCGASHCVDHPHVGL